MRELLDTKSVSGHRGDELQRSSNCEIITPDRQSGLKKTKLQREKRCYLWSEFKVQPGGQTHTTVCRVTTESQTKIDLNCTHGSIMEQAAVKQTWSPTDGYELKQAPVSLVLCSNRPQSC